IPLPEGFAGEWGIYAKDGRMRIKEMRASNVDAHGQVPGRIQLHHAAPVEDRHSHPVQPWRGICRKIPDDISETHEPAMSLKEEAGVVCAKSHLAAKLSLGGVTAIDECGTLIADKPVDLALQGEHKIRPFRAVKVLVVNKARSKAGVIAR